MITDAKDYMIDIMYNKPLTYEELVAYLDQLIEACERENDNEISGE